MWFVATADAIFMISVDDTLKVLDLRRDFRLERLWRGRVMPPDRVMFRTVPERVRSWGLA